MFGLTTLSTLAAWAVIIAPRHKLKALAWQRDQLLDQIGEASADHKT